MMRLKETYRRTIEFANRYLGIPISLTLVATGIWTVVAFEAGIHNKKSATVALHNIAHPISYGFGINQVSTSQLERALQNPESIDAVMEFREKSIESIVEVGGFLSLDEDVLWIYEVENSMKQVYETHEEFARKIQDCNEEQFPLIIDEYNKFMDSLGYPHATYRIIRQIKGGKNKSRIMTLVHAVLVENRAIPRNHFIPSKEQFYECYENNDIKGTYVADFHFHNDGSPPSNIDVEESKKWRTIVFSTLKNGFDMYDSYKGKVTKIEWRKK